MCDDEIFLGSGRLRFQKSVPQPAVSPGIACLMLMNHAISLKSKQGTKICVQA
jgi:hypothetical protein